MQLGHCSGTDLANVVERREEDNQREQQNQHRHDHGQHIAERIGEPVAAAILRVDNRGCVDEDDDEHEREETKQILSAPTVRLRNVVVDREN